MNFQLLKKLFECKFYFQIPQKKKFIIFDQVGSENIKKYLPPNDYYILSVRKERLNFYVIFKILIKFKFSMKAYLYEYIKIINPKVLITFVHNSILFYQLKLKNIKKIVIQNGTCSMHPIDIFFQLEKKKIKNLNCDFIITHNKPVISLFKKYIKNSKFLILGSIKSNKSKINVKKKIFDLVYLSVFRNFSFDKFNNHIDINDWQNKEILLLKFAEKYCLENNKKLTILGVSFDSHTELKFYKKNLDIKFKFIKRHPKRKTYNLVDQSKVLFGIDTTLMSEALGRGAKVAFFSYRGNKFPFNSRKIGWPKKYPYSGEFWDSTAKYKNFEKIINNLYKIKSSEWLKICKLHKINIMNFDPDNKRFKKLIMKL